MKTNDTAIYMHGINKSFNGVRVLEDVDFELKKGEIHALVGGNGAGKSTLMKILEGVYTTDAGTIEIEGKKVEIHSPLDASENGIAMIFQEFSLIPTLTVAQNIFLNRESLTSLGLLNERELIRKTSALFEQMDVDIDPTEEVSRISTGMWQLTEIAKALVQNARILIMDEPTSSLTESETQNMFKLLRQLKEQGISIIYISHRMQEILQICDRITVLRDGRRVITEDMQNMTMEKIIEHVIGRTMEEQFQWKKRDTIHKDSVPLLEVKGLRSKEVLNGVDLCIYPGEILGLAGLMGSGRTETARAIYGIDSFDADEIKVKGKPVRIRCPKDAISMGISLIPEDRRLQGLTLDHTVRENLLLPSMHKLQKGILIDDMEGTTLAQSLVNKLNIRTGGLFRAVRLLSGGNQQKVVISKWLNTDPDILIMDEPTAGVDIGAKTEILNIVRKLADTGKGILIISSELSELLAVSDRILIIRDGRVAGVLDRQEIESEEALHHVVQGV